MTTLCFNSSSYVIVVTQAQSALSVMYALSPRAASTIELLIGQLLSKISVLDQSVVHV